MPKLNKLLVTSIIADIRECVHVSNEIYSWLGDIEHLSWKFPTKTAKDINAMEIVKEHEGTAGEFYILLLELAYDRLFNTFFLPSLVLYSFSFVRYRFASAQTRATTSSRTGRKSFAHAKVHAAQLGMQMFRDRCIVKGGEILFGRTKCKRWLDALGRFARIFPVERSIARVLSSGNGPGAKMIHVFFCGETRSVISFNLYVSLDNWQSWEIKGRLTNRIERIRYGWLARWWRFLPLYRRIVSISGEDFISIFRCRIHFVLRLIVEFMDKFRLADEFFKEVSCVSRSKQISLASLLRLVWDRMKTMPDSISRHMVSQINKVDSSWKTGEIRSSK